MAITLGLGCEVTSAEKAAVVDGWMARRSGASENTRYARKRDKAPETLRPAVERITPVSVVPRENGGISTVLQATSHRPATQKTLSLPTQPQPPGPLFEDKINPETPLLGRLGLHFASKRLISTAKIETAYLCSRSARLSRWRRVFGSRRCLDRCRRVLKRELVRIRRQRVNPDEPSTIPMSSECREDKRRLRSARMGNRKSAPTRACPTPAGQRWHEPAQHLAHDYAPRSTTDR